MAADRWIGLDLRHLAALTAVGKHGSFARAAVELGYTQPAVSQQIAALERMVGQRLFERGSGPQPVTVTEAGQLLLRHAEAIGARLAAAQADMDALAAGAGGILRVGTFQSVSARILPELITRFVAEWPSVEIRLTEREADHELLDLVERGELDATFAMLPVIEGPFDFIELVHDAYMLVVPAGSELAADFSCVADLAELPLISFRSCRSAPLAEQHLRALGVEPHVVFRSDDNGAVQGLVRSGLGSAVMPLLAVDLADEGIEAIELEQVPPRRIAFAWHRDRHRSRPQEAFVELAAEICAGIGAELSLAK